MGTEKIWSSDGRDEVAEVVVPIWAHPVEVYLWGSRVFVRRRVDDGWRYCEARGSYCVVE